MVEDGMPWIRIGIGRRVNGEQNLTNKSFEGYFFILKNITPAMPCQQKLFL
jgi:hypothetical protein